MGEKITIDGKEYTRYGNKWYDLERYESAPPDVLGRIHRLLEEQERKREEEERRRQQEQEAEERRLFEQLKEQYQVAWYSESDPLSPLDKILTEIDEWRIEIALPLIKNVPGLKPDFKNALKPQHDLWNRLFSPDPASGEVWLNPQILADIEQTLAKQKCTSNLEDAESFCRHCWDEIKSEQRRYQVSSQGRVVILATEELSKLIGLESVRFIQEGARAPEVFVRFEFRNPSTIGVIRVKANGSTVGFHEASASDLFQAIIETTALAYYRDLVIPKVHYYHPSGRRGTSWKPPTSRRARPLPRVQSIPISPLRPYRFDEWHEAQARARHYVVGHRRWVGEGFSADWEKQEQAWRAGVDLPLGYTWVVEHERSGGEPSGPTFNGTDLVERTRFLPPERASHELDKLFPTPGIY